MAARRASQRRRRALTAAALLQRLGAHACARATRSRFKTARHASLTHLRVLGVGGSAAIGGGLRRHGTRTRVSARATARGLRRERGVISEQMRGEATVTLALVRAVSRQRGDASGETKRAAHGVRAARAGKPRTSCELPTAHTPAAAPRKSIATRAASSRFFLRCGILSGLGFRCKCLRSVCVRAKIAGVQTRVSGGWRRPRANGHGRPTHSGKCEAAPFAVFFRGEAQLLAEAEHTNVSGRPACSTREAWALASGGKRPHLSGTSRGL